MGYSYAFIRIELCTMYMLNLFVYLLNYTNIYNAWRRGIDKHAFVCIYVKISLNFVLTIKMYQTTLMPSSLFVYFLYLFIWCIVQFSHIYSTRV